MVKGDIQEQKVYCLRHNGPNKFHLENVDIFSGVYNCGNKFNLQFFFLELPMSTVVIQNDYVSIFNS